ncbi:MAG: hypothetical protein ACKO24_01455 [Leptolyngbyaceae cyanobacterium]
MFIPRNFEKKAKGAARKLVWQWFFPAPNLTWIKETGELRRYQMVYTHTLKSDFKPLKSPLDLDK